MTTTECSKQLEPLTEADLCRLMSNSDAPANSRWVDAAKRLLDGRKDQPLLRSGGLADMLGCCREYIFKMGIAQALPEYVLRAVSSKAYLFGHPETVAQVRAALAAKRGQS